MKRIFRNTRPILPAVFVALLPTGAAALPCPCAGTYPSERKKAGLGTIDPARRPRHHKSLCRSFLRGIPRGQEITLAEWPLARISRNHLRNKQELDGKATIASSHSR